MAEAVEAAPANTTSQYDLTRTISKYLDLHMMFPLLDFVEMSNIYPADQVAQARLDLLDATNMVRVNLHICLPMLCCGGRTLISTTLWRASVFGGLDRKQGSSSPSHPLQNKFPCTMYDCSRRYNRCHMYRCSPPRWVKSLRCQMQAAAFVCIYP